MEVEGMPMFFICQGSVSVLTIGFIRWPDLPSPVEAMEATLVWRVFNNLPLGGAPGPTLLPLPLGSQH